MSWQLPLLNFGLRRTELHMLRNLKETEIPAARRSLDQRTRWLLPTPRGVKFSNTELILNDKSLAAIEAKTGHPGTGTLLYLHGGGYFIGSPDSHKKMAGKIARASGLSRAVLPRYRLAPENTYPAALDDALHAYQSLLDTGTPSQSITIGGDSAGGGLALALLGKICALDLPRPACLFALSPWTDLTATAASLNTNAKTEVMLPTERMERTAQAYLNGTPPRDPGASPLFADFSGARPVLIHVSKSEILFDDSCNMAETLQKQGISCELRIENGLPHVWPFFSSILPEGQKTVREIADFVSSHSKM